MAQWCELEEVGGLVDKPTRYPGGPSVAQGFLGRPVLRQGGLQTESGASEVFTDGWFGTTGQRGHGSCPSCLPQPSSSWERSCLHTPLQGLCHHSGVPTSKQQSGNYDPLPINKERSLHKCLVNSLSHSTRNCQSPDQSPPPAPPWHPPADLGGKKWDALGGSTARSCSFYPENSELELWHACGPVGVSLLAEGAGLL